MSTEFYVNMDDIIGEIPIELRYQESDRLIPIGTRFGNGDREYKLDRLIQEELGLIKHSFFSESATIEELRSSDKPYFSKWGKDSEIEFFDTKTRFSWHSNYALDFWDSVLDDSTNIVDEYGSEMSWKELKEAITGPDRYMEQSRFIQGTFVRYTAPPKEKEQEKEG